MKSVEKKILSLIKDKYEIRFPGGKGFCNGSSHASFGVIAKKNFFNQIEVLVLPYKNKISENTLDLRRKDIFNEVPEQTLVRKIQEETGVLISKGEYQFIKSQNFRDSNSKNKNKFHIKNLFFITKFDDSNLRKVKSHYHPNIDIPFWVPIDILGKYISRKHLWMFNEIKNISHSELPKKSLFSNLMNKTTLLLHGSF